MRKGMRMEVFSNAASMMATLFIVVALGYAARKGGLVNDDFDAMLSKVVIWITCPALILDSVLGNGNLPDNTIIWQVLGVTLLLFIPTTLLALLITHFYRTPENAKSAHAFTIVFSNVAFIGFAVSSAILGKESLLYLSVYNLVCTTYIWSLGAWLMSRSGTVKLTRREQFAYVRKNLCTPTIAACLAALVLALLHITDSGIIGYTCNLLGAMTPPATMLIIGSTLAKYRMREMVTDVWSYITAFIRLIAMPAFVYFFGGLFISDTYVLATLALISAMPAAQVGIMMAVAYGGDLLTVSRGMFLTTLLSIITIPIVTMFIV